MREDLRIGMKATAREGREWAPFPGSHPTRIFWWVTTNRRSYSYKGKPSHMATLRLEKLLRDRQTRQFEYFEVDTKGTVVSCGGRLDDFVPHQSITWQMYHPWDALGIPWRWMLKRWYVVPIKLKTDKIVRVYSPRMRLNQELHVVPYVTWRGIL